MVHAAIVAARITGVKGVRILVAKPEESYAMMLYSDRAHGLDLLRRDARREQAEERRQLRRRARLMRAGGSRR